MVLVALAEAAVIVLIVGAFLRALASQQRSHARREDLLVNQLLHSVGRDWQPSPADEHRRASRAEDRGFTPPSWTPTPEQLPVE
jgi:hypothetical protein